MTVIRQLRLYAEQCWLVFWGAAKLVPVGYGIKKLSIMMTIEDDKVGLDDLIEDRLTLEGSECGNFIQSCDIAAFNKICELSLLVGRCV